MTRETYLSWANVFDEIDEIRDHVSRLCDLHPGIDFGHWVAERIRQLGRDMEAPTGPVVGERKDDDTIENGFGGSWSAWCPVCGKKSMEIVRPGKAQCPDCD